MIEEFKKNGCDDATAAMLNSVFKAYDIRGVVPEQLDERFAMALGKSIASTQQPKTAVIGYDARLSSPMLATALSVGLISMGIHTSCLGLCGTEEIYYAAARHNFDVGIMVTGSHNPANENGFKIVGKGAIPVDSASGLKSIAIGVSAFMAASKSESCNLPAPASISFRSEYVKWLIDYAGINQLPKNCNFKIVVDPGNGAAGPMLEALIPNLPFTIIPINFEPDGNFPHGVPNPLLPERRKATAKAVIAHKADLGVAFDGDFDRCFFFDAAGQMAESCYLIGPMAAELLGRHKNAAIVHDTRVYWLTRDMVIKASGKPVISKGGHSCMKRTMREQEALFGGEMSAHYFYRDFAYCDSGMLTFLLVVAILLRSGKTLQELVETGSKQYPCSGEINFKVKSVPDTLAKVLQKYEKAACDCMRLDGLDLQFSHWRFSLRGSNTEPLLRLNVETKGDAELLNAKVDELKAIIAQHNS